MPDLADAVLFTGQGSQRPDMGRRLAESDSDAMELWKLAEKESGLPLREIYWEGDKESRADTRSEQPAITAFNFNLWRKFRNQITPFACAGHSLGEFSALAACGILSPADAIKITALRGKLMAEADPDGTGAMAAIVRLQEQEVLDIVSDTCAETGKLLVAANFNTPVQTVISGHKDAVQAACQKAAANKARTIMLKVSGAFHSPMMAEANREFMPWLDRLDWRDPRIPFYANAGAGAIMTGSQAREAMKKQMVSPVIWTRLIRNLYQAGAAGWLEIGPRPVLSKLIEPNLADADGSYCIRHLCSFHQGISTG